MQDHIEFCHTLQTVPFPCNVRIPFLAHVIETSFSPKYFCNSVIFCLMCCHFDNLAYLKNSLTLSSQTYNIESETTYVQSCTCTCSWWDALGNRETLWIPSTEISHQERRTGLDRRFFTLNSRGTLRILLS